MKAADSHLSTFDYDLQMDLATRIRAARRQSGMSQKTMAVQLGVSRGAIANWESSGHAQPSRTNLGKVAAITGVKIEWLARGHGSMIPCPFPDDTTDNGPLIARDAVEARLLNVFRLSSENDKSLIMEVIDSIAALLG
ncbi:MAG: helix-turn-helix transcriptional regulator [Proteobacteria bacterium]|nr:helix-turn-helix transcriptional regulator [Pseudomonadota bacterium]